MIFGGYVTGSIWKICLRPPPQKKKITLWRIFKFLGGEGERGKKFRKIQSTFCMQKICYVNEKYSLLATPKRRVWLLFLVQHTSSRSLTSRSGLLTLFYFRLFLPFTLSVQMLPLLFRYDLDVSRRTLH